MSLAHQITTEILAYVPSVASNPLDGVTPNIDIFGVKIKSGAAMILGGIWGVIMVLIAGSWLIAWGSYALAKKRGHADSLAEGADNLKRSDLAMAGCACAGVILAAVLFFSGQIGA